MQGTRRHTQAARAAAAALAATALAAGAAADDLEDALRARWNGTWSLTRVETYSDCDSAYANNEITGTRVTSRAGLAFAAGELVRVDKVNVKSSRVDVYASVVEPLRRAREDGPFTLYDTVTCRLQLMVDVAGKDIREKRAAPIQDAIAAVLSPFAARDEAQAAEAWNRRVLEPLPADYADTLARHQAWKVEQVNAALAAVRDRAVDDATRVAERVDDDPQYLDGFARGLGEARHWSPGSCEALASADFATFERREPKEHRGDEPAHRSWQRGYRDGQALGFNLALARAAGRCFLPPPPAPPG